MAQKTDAPAIRDGTYVAAEDGDLLFRVKNKKRQPIEPDEVARHGIAQKDVQLVDSLVLERMPVERAHTRAVGRGINSYLKSDLKSGHYMSSWVWLQGTTLTTKTRTETITLFGGYTGGVQVVLFDAAGNRILHDTIRYRYGIDGRAFGPGTREDTETFQLPQNVADAAETIVVAHYWDPKVNIVGVAIEIAKVAWQLIQLILEQQRKGEAVNAGGRPF